MMAVVAGMVLAATALKPPVCLRVNGESAVAILVLTDERPHGTYSIPRFGRAPEVGVGLAEVTAVRDPDQVVATTVTDGAGGGCIGLSPGSYEIRASAAGFAPSAPEPIRVPRDSVVRLRIRLERRPPNQVPRRRHPIAAAQQ